MKPYEDFHPKLLFLCLLNSMHYDDENETGCILGKIMNKIVVGLKENNGWLKFWQASFNSSSTYVRNHYRHHILLIIVLCELLAQHVTKTLVVLCLNFQGSYHSFIVRVYCQFYVCIENSHFAKIYHHDNIFNYPY